MLICQYMCYCCRPGSIRADAFRGHGLSLLEKTTFSACDVSQRSFPCPAGGKASMRPRVAKLAEAQQPPAESEVYTGCGRTGNFHYQRYKSNIDRSYFAVYRCCVKNNNSFQVHFQSLRKESL